MHDYIYKLKANAEAVRRVTGWQRPNGYGLGPVGRTRDSDVLEESNFAVVLADLQAIDDRVDVVSFGHFACGWIEEILVPLTDAIAEAVEKWDGALSDYPIADEHDFSEREYADAILTLTACYNVDDEETAGWIYSYLYEKHSQSSGEDYRNADVDEAKLAFITHTLESLGMDADDLQVLIDADSE